MKDKQFIKSPLAIFILVTAVLMSLFHIYTSFFGQLPGLQQRSIHLAFALVLSFFIYPFWKGLSGKLTSFINILFSIFGLITCGNICFVIYYVLNERAGAAMPVDIWLGGILIVLILDMTRRIMGWALPIITLVFIAYAFLGSYIPIPYLRHPGVDLSQFIAYQYLSTEGIFTAPLAVSATYIAIFVIFAAFLVHSGVGDFFMATAFAIAGHRTGGAAKVAVVGSSLMGMVTGSAVGNVVTIGTVTIPLMKKMGFPATLASGVEAVASTGGQIMPPMMGAAAFIMASIVGKSYLYICIAAFLPAVLYYLAVFITVHLEAQYYGVERIPKETLPKLWPILKDKGYLIIPMFVLLGYLIAGATALKAGFYATLSVVLVSAIKKETRMNLKKMLLALEGGAKAMLAIAAACACSGIVVGVLTLTGLGLKLSFLIVQISQGSALILLILAMLTCFVLGMGITTTAAYLLVAIIVAPMLKSMGISELAAHMFVFYYACLSTITPPVALAAYAAAGVADCDPFKTGIVAFRIGISAYIIPFYIIYLPSIMIVEGTFLLIIWGLFKAAVGIYALSSASVGYMFRKLKIHERLFLALIMLTTVPHFITVNLIGIGVIAIITLVVWKGARVQASKKLGAGDLPAES